MKPSNQCYDILGLLRYSILCQCHEAQGKNKFVYLVGFCKTRHSIPDP